MSDEQFRQEFLCDFTAAIVGAYYAKLLESPVRGPAYDPALPVCVSADLGYTDSSAYWFWQEYPDGECFIDYEEADNQPLAYYFDLLNYKGFEYDTIWLPHDAVAKTLQTGRSTVEQFISAEFPVKIAPRLAVQHGVDAARKMLPGVRWDLDNPRVLQGIDTLRSYRRSYDEIHKVYREVPLHDWTSHCADAFRGYALTCRRATIAPPEKPSGPPRYGFSLEDLYSCQPKRSLRI